MLNRTEIQDILQTSYIRENWIKLINSISKEPLLYKKPKDIEIKNEIVKNAFELGSFDTTDGMIIGLYEIEIVDNIQIERNRVGLRNLLRKQYKQVDGCFAVYYQGNKWRFSYISETREFENDEWIESKTEPKRYTYVLGEGETVRTATDRFYELFNSTKLLNDIKIAFSIEGVTDEFYTELRKVYNEIQGYITGINKENKKVFAQLIINRLLFLRFLEKKGWLFINQNDTIEERKKYFATKRASLGQQNQWSQFFVHLFFKGLNKNSVSGTRETTDAMSELIGYVPYLNGGLFEESKDWNDYEIKVDNRLFFSIFDNLFNNFNFTVAENTPLDIEVALNPDLLGYAYEEMIAERHGQGAYYTHPTEVGLMCRESIKTYLKEHTSIDYDKLIDLVNDWSPDTLTESESFDIYELLLKVKILDPAVGSGAYPVRMMQELTEIHFALSQKLSSGTLKQIIKNKLTNPTSFYELKRSIIQNNLYGADIDHFAVEIAKLRFWLSLVVDFNEEIKSADDLKKIPALPNLDFKLRTGDSLLAIPGKVKIDDMFGERDAYVNLDEYLADEKLEDFFNNETLEEIKRLKNLYFDFEEARKNDKELFKTTKEELKIKIADLEKQFFNSMGFKLKEDPDSLKHIIWQIHYAEVFDKNKFGFDICIANPPYLRQEKINDMFETFNSDITKDDLVTTYERLYQKLKIKIDKKSDLYVYFFLRGLNLLKEKGVLCYICSNSWLDVGYGKVLQEVLLRNTRIISIYDNIAKRSFAKADINTTINLFVKDTSIDFSENVRKLSIENLVKFTAFKKDFDVSTTTNMFKELNSISSIYVNNTFRCYAISQKELLNSSMNEQRNYEGDKWGGKYLRAPDIYFTIVDRGKNLFVNLSSLSKLNFGMKTGVNEFFIINNDTINNFAIEKKYIKPIIKSPRESKNIHIDQTTLTNMVFICNSDKHELKGTNALKYINWGEKQKNENNIYWCNVPSVKGRSNWYSLNENSIDDYFLPRTYNDTFICYKGGINYSDRFYGLSTKNEFLLTYLNSSIFALFLESLAKQGLGQGALDLNIRELNKIPTPKALNKTFLIKRQIENVFKESGIKADMNIRAQIPNPQYDRKVIDDIIFEALGLSNDERNEVYWSLCELVQNRINKANSV